MMLEITCREALMAVTWGHRDGTEVMREVLDADGCRHYRIETGESDD